MAARAALLHFLGTDPQLNMLGWDEERFFASNATDTPARDALFAVINWEETARSRGGLRTYLVSIWYHVPVHMEQDYGKIDLAIMRTEELASDMVHLEGEDGWVLSAASWIGSSGDLSDDGYDSLTKYVQLRCACRNVA